MYLNLSFILEVYAGVCVQIEWVSGAPPLKPI